MIKAAVFIVFNLIHSTTIQGEYRICWYADEDGNHRAIRMDYISVCPRSIERQIIK